jgi:hypothetical protein
MAFFICGVTYCCAALAGANLIVRPLFAKLLYGKAALFGAVAICRKVIKVITRLIYQKRSFNDDQGMGLVCEHIGKYY